MGECLAPLCRYTVVLDGYAKLWFCPQPKRFVTRYPQGARIWLALRSEPR
jgi:hypothetical protein